jgi:hypothetical protein
MVLRMILRTPVWQLDQQVVNRGFNNISSVNLSPSARLVLSLGAKYRLPPRVSRDDISSALSVFSRRVRLSWFFGDSEKDRYHVPSVSSRQFDVSVSSALTSHLDRASHRVLDAFNSNSFPIRHHLAKRIRRGLNDLRSDNTIVVKPADKNLGLTVCDRDWYEKECFVHLDDTTTYAKYNATRDTIKHNLSSNLRRFVDRYFLFIPIKDRHKHTTADLDTANKYPCNAKLASFVRSRFDNWQFPAFYGIPKLHKSPVVLRPICASHSYITTPLSIWLADQLNPLVSNFPIVCTGSKQFINRLRTVQLSGVDPTTIWLITGDIKSLYPNIRIALGIQVISNVLSRFATPCGPPDRVLATLRFLLTNHYVDFLDTIYKQLSGTAMGVSFAPPYANLFMATALDSCITTRSLATVFSQCYIDDIFMIHIGSQETAQALTVECSDFLKTNYHVDVDWSYSNDRNNYLDVTIVNTCDGISYEPYAKTINKFLYIPYSSFHPSHAKDAFIHTELVRLHRNSANHRIFLRAASEFWFHLRQRGYPSRYLNRVRNKFDPVFQLNYDSLRDRPNNTTVSAPPIAISIPFCQFTRRIRVRALLNPDPRAYQECTQSELQHLKRAVISHKNGGNLGKLIIRARHQHLINRSILESFGSSRAGSPVNPIPNNSKNSGNVP